MNKTTVGEKLIEAANKPRTTLASRWLRLCAAIVDALILSAVILPINHYLMSDNPSLQTTNPIDMTIIGIQYCVIYSIVFLLIQGLLLHQKGQTIGKYIFDIAIVSIESNKKSPFWPLYAKRYFLFFFLSSIPYINVISLIDILCIFRKDKRCLHDLIAGTKVIDVSDPES